jgi:hypothetical protein
MKHEHGYVEPGFFVPSFSVKRPVVKTDELEEFLEGVRERLPSNYKVARAGSLAMTLLEQNFLIRRFRAIDYEPDPDEINGVVESLLPGMRHSLGPDKSDGRVLGVPRKLFLPLQGRVDTFGKLDAPTKLGVIPNGWKGFRAHYAERDKQKKGSHEEVLPMPILVRESQLIYGAIETGFSHIEDFIGSGRGNNPMNMTPHITIAQKQKGGSISQSEAASMQGLLEEIIPERLQLFDPVLYYRPTPDRDSTQSITFRPTRGMLEQQ